MSPREKNLAILLVGVLGLGLIAFAGVRFWYQPWSEGRKTVETLEKENADIQAAIYSFDKERKKLQLARFKSMSDVADYQTYLRSVFSGAGMYTIQLDNQKGTKLPLVNPIPGVKQVGHELFAFTVSTKGELSQLVKALQQLGRTPFEHRIKTLTIAREDLSTKKDASARLTINLTIEALVLSKPETRPGLPPGVNAYMILAGQIHAPIDFGMVAAAVLLQQATPTPPPDRDYADIARRNIFVGAIPIPPAPVKIKDPPPVVKVEPKEPKKTEPDPPDVNVLEYVYLTTCIPDQKTAYMWNRLYDPPEKEMKLIAKKGTGYDTFAITGPETELGRYRYFRAKINKVELRKIYFQIKNDVYSLEVGQKLSDAQEISRDFYTRTEMIDMGWFDPVFAAEEAAAAAKDAKEKDKGKKTKTKNPKGG